MSDTAAPHSSQTARGYYSSFANSPGLGGKFHDIDNEVHFRQYLHCLQDMRTQNFLLDFGNDDAWCAINLEREDFSMLLSKPRPKCFGTRWINIWAPEEQKESIKAITTHYAVSERLQGMMCTDPAKRRSKPTAAIHNESRSKSIDRSYQPRADDLEGAYDLKDLSDPDAISQIAALKNLTFAEIADQIWHFCSVDYGLRYTCIGYNSLYTVPGSQSSDAQDRRGLPDGVRLWSWIILCDDGTVISMQENPFPQPQASLKEAEIKPVLDVVRRNIKLIFSGVSKQHSASSESASLVTIRVRHFSDTGPDQASIKQDDGPSLLFYYIFDDWVSSYSLIAKREHSYGVELDKLRQKMLEKPDVTLIDELHWFGRKLAVLKRLYQSYELIMTRILQRQRLLRDEARSHRRDFSVGNTFSEHDFAELRQSTLQSNRRLGSTYDALAGVQLGSAAVGRFERLADRINLYCLCEIDACLTEKESLAFLNFNLIALKDSQAVEKLTRITILLAKATILFLPVSLMTAYFSTEIEQLKGVYTTNDYWISFGVIMLLSMIVLYLFGYASGTVEGKTIYRSLVQTFFRSSKEKIQQRKAAHVK